MSILSSAGPTHLAHASRVGRNFRQPAGAAPSGSTGANGGTALVRSATLLSLLLVPLLAACDDAVDGRAQTETEPPPPTVTVARPLVQRLTEWDEFTGRFEAVEQVEVRARVQGYLESVHFEDGQIVEKGHLLFVIDQRPFKNSVNIARASVAAAEAAYEQARITERRSLRLRDNDSPAFQRADYEDQIQSRLQARSQLDRTQAELAAAELDLSFTKVTAPVRGRISYRRADVGNLVVSDTMLTTIVALDPIYFAFDMSEADFVAYQRAVDRGELPSTRDNATTVNIRLADEEGWPRVGRMNFVDNVVDGSAGTVRARAIVANPNYFLAPGQFGIIRIPGSPFYDAILISDEAIVSDQARKLVLTLADDGTVQPKEIRPGPRELGLRIVRRGLTAEDRVIIKGVTRARPGARVTAEEGVIELPPAPAEPVGSAS